MTWRPAKSLEVLRDQVNKLAPKRSKASDGLKGDSAHAARTSDHNPDENGVVRGMDITNDPANGMSSQALADALVASKDERIRYIISNRKIASGKGGPSPWVWRTYTGANPHNHHVHISVVHTDDADDTTPWKFKLGAKKMSDPEPEKAPDHPLLEEGASGKDVELLQFLLNENGATLALDGTFGPQTRVAVARFQKRRGLVVDGVAGTYTWEALA